MDKFLVLQDKKTALALSEKEAFARGCGTGPNDVTRYWWSNSVTKDGKVALRVPVEDEGGLSPAERASITAHVVFPDPAPIAGNLFVKAQARSIT